MQIYQILSLLLGAGGIGYALRTLFVGHIPIYSYRKKEFIDYTGSAGQVVSIGLLIASISLILVGLNGFVTWELLILAAGSYYGALMIANRMMNDK